MNPYHIRFEINETHPFMKNQKQDFRKRDDLGRCTKLVSGIYRFVAIL